MNKAVGEWHIEEITDPATGRVQRYEAATEEDLDALIAADWPDDPAPPDKAHSHEPPDTP